MIAEIVRGVDLDVFPGEKLGIVGESGSGKTPHRALGAAAAARPAGAAAEGRRSPLPARISALSTTKAWQKVRGAEIAMVYQDPMTSLNPLAAGAHPDRRNPAGPRRRPATAAYARCREVLGQVGLPDPARVERAFPHELSGGMLQRVMIAIALAVSPRLLIADEPTTALDVTIQQQILELVEDIQARTGMAVVWVTHDLGVVARIVDQVVVMYAGRVVERAPTRQLFARPSHPYTLALLGSLPHRRTEHRQPLTQIGGTARPTRPASSGGCPFRARCPFAFERCARRGAAADRPRAGRRRRLLEAPDEWQAM